MNYQVYKVVNSHDTVFFVVVLKGKMEKKQFLKLVEKELDDKDLPVYIITTNSSLEGLSKISLGDKRIIQFVSINALNPAFGNHVFNQCVSFEKWEEEQDIPMPYGFGSIMFNDPLAIKYGMIQNETYIRHIDSGCTPPTVLQVVNIFFTKR